MVVTLLLLGVVVVVVLVVVVLCFFCVVSLAVTTYEGQTELLTSCFCSVNESNESNAAYEAKQRLTISCYVPLEKE